MAMAAPTSGGSRQQTKTPLRLSSRVVVCTALVRVAKRTGKTIGILFMAERSLYILRENEQSILSRTDRTRHESKAGHARNLRSTRRFLEKKADHELSARPEQA